MAHLDIDVCRSFYGGVLVTEAAPYRVALRHFLRSLMYSRALVEELVREYSSDSRKLRWLTVEVTKAAQSLTNKLAEEHLTHGAGRRLSIMGRCLDNVFHFFPPSRTERLPKDDLDQVQISLHAFVMNLSGLFDNLAWSFILRHNLMAQVGGRKSIGLFLPSTQRFLPAEIENYLTAPTITDWHNQYLKNYRDALAHRIPLYIPPMTLTDEEATQYHALEEQITDCSRRGEPDRVGELMAEQGALGMASPVFIHSYSEGDRTRPLMLHPQMLSDTKAVLEFVPLYLAHWHEYEQ